MRAALFLLLLAIGIPVITAVCHNGVLDPGEECDTGAGDLAGTCVNCTSPCKGTCSNLRRRKCFYTASECTVNATCQLTSTSPNAFHCVLPSSTYSCQVNADCPVGWNCVLSAPFTNSCFQIAQCNTSGAICPITSTCNSTCFSACVDGFKTGNELCDDGSIQGNDGCVNCACQVPAVTINTPTWCSAGNLIQLIVKWNDTAWMNATGGSCLHGVTNLGPSTCNATHCKCQFFPTGNWTGDNITITVNAVSSYPGCVGQNSGARQAAFVLPNPVTLPFCQGLCGNGQIDAGEQCDDGNGAGGDGCTNCQKTCLGTCSVFPDTCTSNSTCFVTVSCFQGAGSATCSISGHPCLFSGCPPGYTCFAFGPGTCSRTVASGTCPASCPNISGTCSCNAAVCGDNITTSPEQCDDGSIFTSDGCNACQCQTITGSVTVNTNAIVCAPGQPINATGTLVIPSWAQVYNATCRLNTSIGTLICSSSSCSCSVTVPAQPWNPAGLNLVFTVGVRNTKCPTQILMVTNQTTVPISQQLPCVNFCGNGVLESGEACDDGNQVNGDGCSHCVRDCTRVCSNFNLRQCTSDASCTSQPTCSGGSCVVNQVCGGPGSCPSGYTCEGGTQCSLFVGSCWIPCGIVLGTCGPLTCTQTCGDNITQGSEQCDDGTLFGEDGCVNCTCSTPPSTNFSVDHSDNICAEGQAFTANTTLNLPSWVQLITGSCTLGNMVGSISCFGNACTCTIDPLTGPFNPGGEVLNITFGVRNRKCPSFVTQITNISLVPVTLDTCSNFCGNGILEQGEVCDDGNQIDGDGCTNCQRNCSGACSNFNLTTCFTNASCTISPSCTTVAGGSIRQCKFSNRPCGTCPVGYTCGPAPPPGGNECTKNLGSVASHNCSECVDESGTCGPSTLTPVCIQTCGDEIVQGSEQCDDGSVFQDDGCVNCTCIEIPTAELFVSTQMQICGPNDTIIVDASFSVPNWVNLTRGVCFLDSEHFGVLVCSLGVCTCTFTTPVDMFDLFPCDYGVPVTVEISLQNPACPNITLNLTQTIFVPILHCNDNLFCNGEESCSTTLGCLPGSSPICNDGNDCTVDFCQESACRMACQNDEFPVSCAGGCANSEAESYTLCLEQLQNCVGNALTCNSQFQACYTGSGCRMAISDTSGCPCRCNFVKQPDQTWPEPE